MDAFGCTDDRTVLTDIPMGELNHLQNTTLCLQVDSIMDCLLGVFSRMKQRFPC